MSSILDDAREKIASVLLQVFNDGFVLGEIGMGGDKETVDAALYQILALSGTKDIECPECHGDERRRIMIQDKPTPINGLPCSKCINGVIRHKWKVSVTLKNGELPEVDDTYKDFGGNDTIWEESQQSMLNAKYRQVVE